MPRSVNGTTVPQTVLDLTSDEINTNILAMKKKLKLHETIPALLRKRNMTLRGLAKASGVPASNLSAWQIPGARPKDILQVSDVAEALDVSLNYLLFGKPEKKINLDELPSEVVLSGVYRLKLERIVPQPNNEDEEY